MWVYGGVAAVGAYLLLKPKSGPPKAGGADASGGQGMPGYGNMVPQNIGGDADQLPGSSAGVFGALTSQINDGFFGAGPLSLWSGSAMDYSGQFGGGHRRRHRRHRDGRPYGVAGDDFPVGAGGYGVHHWHGYGNPEAPPGGEGFDNAGQSTIGGFGGGMAGSGGNPWAQQTTMSTQGDMYLVQDGDDYQKIAHKLWGRGADAGPLIEANRNFTGHGGKSSGRHLPSGLILTVPGAPHSGPAAPGGPAGNGVGGGSISSTGNNPGIGTAPGGVTDDGNALPGAGTSSAGAPGGGSPTEGHSYGNSSRVKNANGSRSYAVSGSEGGDPGSGVKMSNNTKQKSKAKSRR